MDISHSKDNNKLYDIKLEIKSYIEISKKDKRKINDVVLILDTLGYDDKEIDEKLYRFTSEQENEELLLDVQHCKPEKIEEEGDTKIKDRFERIGLSNTTS